MAKKTILIVDELMMAQSLKLNLSAYDEIEVMTVITSGGALEGLRSQKVDLLVVELYAQYGSADVILKEETDSNNFDGGRWLIKDIQETLEVDIPVILMGTYPELLSAARIKLGLPADNIMLKPFDTFRFEQRCCELLGLRSKVLAAIAQEWK